MITIATGFLLLIIIFSCEQGTLIGVVVSESLEAGDLLCGALAALFQLLDGQSKLRHDGSDLIDGGRGLLLLCFPFLGPEAGLAGSSTPSSSQWES